MQRQQQRLLAALFLIGYASSAGVVQSANYYVSKTGSNSNPGTTASPFLTINYGVSRLSAGDTLWVRAGVYDESLIYNVPSGASWTNKVRIAASPGAVVTMRPTSGNFVLAFAGSSNAGRTGEQKYIEVDGINLDATGGITNEAVKIEAAPGYNAHHIRIQNLTVTSNANPPQAQEHPGNANAILVTGLRADAIGFNEFINLVVTGGPSVDVGNDFSSMFYIQTPDNLIANCNISNGIGAGVQLYNGNSPGSMPDRTVIRNNIIRDFTRSLPTRGWGVIAYRGDGSKIYNNLIYNIALTGPGSSGIYLNNVTNTSVYNNTVYANASYGIQVDADASGTTVGNNISYGNGVQDYANRGRQTTEMSNLFGIDPQFVNPATKNFQLQTGSPAVNAGTAISVVTSDLAGRSRPQGGRYDIGAFELSDGEAKPPSTPTQLHVIVE
jgi:hypothetical protein